MGAPGAGSARPPERPTVELPPAILVASEWSWRLLLIGFAVVLLGWLLLTLRVVVVPLLVAVLITALIVPVTNALSRVGIARGVAAGLTLLGLVLLVLGLLALVGQQVAAGYAGLARQLVRGLNEIKLWLIRGPLGLSERDIDEAFNSLGALVTTDQLTQGALQVGTTLGHIVAGLLLTLFATYFLLYEGARIWAWVVRLFPRRARGRVDSSARRGWMSLTAFVRATVMVAAVDAVGIALVALILGLPFVVPIGVLVFLTSFVPIVGALVSGAVAVLLALVVKGPVIAIVMLGGVLLVQQAEAHILQPFLMGHFVRIHPLAILLAITTGAYLAGIVGALFAVPLTAFINAVAFHLANERSDVEV
ncbi:AI-2E family transporter [Thermasporomyces composti]|jgi:predicted PurR-regulated permease PerM|uniref:Putative PurR-regulated permease PerM n=1 Tax=Thermasporomyces composti TaxID=696763 RepID=A0A3D9V4L9_THECX|nr:AI-2E family transporter [Thermasporomyces composti]REF35643.1 putative PurR-regulated permease PerM [Thermasporomyces composti]